MAESAMTQETKAANQALVLAWINEILAQDNRREPLAAMFSDESFAGRFFWAPASTKFHSSHAGGLWDHTRSVIDMAFKLAPLQPELVVTRPSLFIAALCHDIGKIGDRNNEMYVAQGSSYRYNNAVKLPHEALSLWWLQLYHVALTVEEWQAINWHNGPYIPGYDRICYQEYPCLTILHQADMISSKRETAHAESAALQSTSA